LTDAVSVIKLFLVLSFFVVLMSQAFAESSEKTNSDLVSPMLIIPGDIYIKSNKDIPVNFEVKALDDREGPIKIECDRISGSKFKLGKTLVRCAATDQAGNMTMKSFVVTVGFNIVKIPSWIKQITNFWLSDRIDDQTYMRTIGYLISNDIVHIPTSKIPDENSNPNIQPWIKSIAKSWVNKKISDDEYSIALQWLIDNRHINF